MRANAAEPEAMQRLADTIGDRNAKRLMQIHSVPFRLADGSLMRGILRLREEFGISGDGLVTFMSDSGAARLGELGISGDGLVRFMSGSVAARLEDEAFWAGLARLGELGISGDGLVRFMSGSVA